MLNLFIILMLNTAIISLFSGFLFTKIWSVAAPMVEVDKETEEKNYLLWRIENGVAEGSTEIPKGSFFFFHKFHPQLTVLLALMFSNSVFSIYQVSFFVYGKIPIDLSIQTYYLI